MYYCKGYEIHRGKNILVLSNQTMICALLTETVFLEECMESQTQQQAECYLFVTNIFDPRRQKQYVSIRV